MIELYDYQIEAIDKLSSGKILCAGVGSGKSRTALAYYFLKECEGKLKINGKGTYSPMKNPKDLYIITTAKKRDSDEWIKECGPFMLTSDPECNESNVKLIVDSWNNINKYSDIENSFFIFDEQRVVGSGAWVKAFLKITKKNNWLLLSATPGDTWSDYIPVFIANGFYKNRTEFIREHAVYNRYAKFPKIDHYVNKGKLVKYRRDILVTMNYEKRTRSHNHYISVDYDQIIYKDVIKNRWNIFENKPIRDISELCYILRKLVNSDPNRIQAIEELIKEKKKVIIFYNYDYELEILRDVGKRLNITTAEWNGHKHMDVPKGDSWIYLVQYTAGAEGWNCITTDTIIFYSQSYSYKATVQAAGRIDRLNTPYTDLHYYYIRSTSSIDFAIYKALKQKRNFNESSFIT